MKHIGIYKMMACTMAMFSLSISATTAQTSTQFFTEITLNSGLISNPGADLSLLSLKARPQLSLGYDLLRIGPEGGLFYNKGFEALYVAHAMVRIVELTADDFLSFGGLYLGAGHTWSTDDSKVFSGSVHLDLATWFGVEIEYGRDYHFDRNWISLGFSFILGGNGDEDVEDIIEDD